MFLQDKDLNEETSTALTREMEERLTALLSRWNDAEFRSTLLLPALEEATFYMPFHQDTNALVVIGIRNCPTLQELHSTQGLLDDSEVRALTTQAIEFFAEADLTQAADELQAQSHDPFAHLPTKYPLAWEACKQLALASKYPKSYEALPADSAELPQLPSLADEDLREDLSKIQNGEISFLFRDSFKMISRDFDTLFHVIETVLRANKTVITHNFYLSNGLVARRKPLLKPAGKPSDIAKKFENKKGLVSRHKDSLRLIKKFIVPAETPAAPAVE